MPTALADDMFSAVAQMDQVNQLKGLMKKIIDSTNFKDLESGQPVLNDANNLESDQLKEALNKILTEKVLDSTRAVKTPETTDTVDLYINDTAKKPPRDIK